jgi:hypothetical protein
LREVVARKVHTIWTARFAHPYVAGVHRPMF